VPVRQPPYTSYGNAGRLVPARKCLGGLDCRKSSVYSVKLRLASLSIGAGGHDAGSIITYPHAELKS
jgi:hypothetical protein